MRYTESQQLVINRFFDKLAAVSNKTGKMLDSKKIKIIQSWDQFPPQIVIDSLEAYLKMDLQKASYGKGKNEKYVLGIMRNKEGDKHGGAGKLRGRNDGNTKTAGADEGGRLSKIIGTGQPTDDELDCDF